MSNGQLHDDKLFQGLHDRLSDYEAPYNGADWDAMSRSLDKLPKTNQFRWKFSLNTIGIMLGIVGLTVVGVVIASGHDNHPATQPDSRNVSNVNTTPAPAANNNVQVTNTQVVSNNSSVPVITVSNGSATPEMNSHKDLNNPKRNSADDNIPFRLGDQIDPVKGFVNNTKEDPALMKSHGDMKQPDVYYDIDENGNVKPIKIKHKHDTASGMQEIKQDSAPHAPAIDPEPTAPTDGQRVGFGDDEPRQ